MEPTEHYSNSEENKAEINSITSKESLKLEISSNNQKDEIPQNKLADDEQIKFFNKDSAKKIKKRLTPNIIPYIKQNSSSKHVIRHKNTIFEKAISQAKKEKKQQSNFKEILYNYVNSAKQIPIKNDECIIEGEPVKLKSEKDGIDIFTLKKNCDEEIEESNSYSYSSSESSSNSESIYKKSQSIEHSTHLSQIISESNESKKISKNDDKNDIVDCNNNNYYYEYKNNNLNILKNSFNKDVNYINDNFIHKIPSINSDISFTGTTKTNTRCSSVQSVQTNNNKNKSSKSNLMNQISDDIITSNSKNTDNAINALNLIAKLKNLNISLSNEKNYEKYLNDLNVKTNSIKKYIQNKINMKFDKRTSAFIYVNIFGQEKDLHSKTHISTFFAKLKHKKSM